LVLNAWAIRTNEIYHRLWDSAPRWPHDHYTRRSDAWNWTAIVLCGLAMAFNVLIIIRIL